MSSLYTFPTILAVFRAFGSHVAGTAAEPTTLGGSVEFDRLVGLVRACFL
jgi:hypothetical protein